VSRANEEALGEVLGDEPGVMRAEGQLMRRTLGQGACSTLTV
jgi:hypothetical protein